VAQPLLGMHKPDSKRYHRNNTMLVLTESSPIDTSLLPSLYMTVICACLLKFMSSTQKCDEVRPCRWIERLALYDRAKQGGVLKTAWHVCFEQVEHPYDVGDTVLIKGELYRVKKISLLYTMFLHVNGEK